MLVGLGLQTSFWLGSLWAEDRALCPHIPPTGPTECKDMVGRLPRRNLTLRSSRHFRGLFWDLCNSAWHLWAPGVGLGLGMWQERAGPGGALSPGARRRSGVPQGFAGDQPCLGSGGTAGGRVGPRVFLQGEGMRGVDFGGKVEVIPRVGVAGAERSGLGTRRWPRQCHFRSGDPGLQPG